MMFFGLNAQGPGTGGIQSGDHELDMAVGDEIERATSFKISPLSWSSSIYNFQDLITIFSILDK